MHHTFRRTARGITLLETLLALAVGAFVIVASVGGVQRYTQGVQVQASAGQLERIIAAADTWANDNYQDILNEAPRLYTAADTQTELGDYLGQGAFPQDTFRGSYRLATRRYTYTVPDPADSTATLTRDAFQVLVVGENAGPNDLTTNDELRISIANTAGRGAGFVSTATATCSDGVGGSLPPGNICGAFGSYAIDVASAGFPPGTMTNAVTLGLITKGDSSFYGDQLYRYNYGDPELNTMRTSILMDSATDPNAIVSPSRTLGLAAGTLGGNPATMTLGANSAGVTDGSITLRPGASNRVVIQGPGGGEAASFQTDTRTLFMGERITRTLGGGTGGTATPLELGDGEVRGERFMARFVNAKEISTLWSRADSPLRLQRFAGGEVIIGRRARYNAAGAAVGSGPAGAVTPTTSTYEISDGRLLAGHVVAQDITCADCGGSLSQIMPRWRHMATYFVGYTSGVGSYVPYPACGNSRRDTVTRAATTGSDPEPSFANSAQDTRYRPSILLIPRQLRQDGVDNLVGRGEIPFDSRMEAFADPTNSRWRVVLHRPDDNIITTAFAMTYCVFTGGEGSFSPTSTAPVPMYGATPSGVGVWTPLE